MAGATRGLDGEAASKPPGRAPSAERRRCLVLGEPRPPFLPLLRLSHAPRYFLFHGDAAVSKGRCRSLGTLGGARRTLIDKLVA